MQGMSTAARVTGWVPSAFVAYVERRFDLGLGVPLLDAHGNAVTPIATGVLYGGELEITPVESGHRPARAEA